MLILLEYGGNILKKDRYKRTTYDIVSMSGLFDDSFCTLMRQKFEQAKHEKEMVFQAFFKAVKEGDLVAVKRHLDKKRHHINRELEGMTPVRVALEQLNKKMIGLLLEYGSRDPGDWWLIKRYHFRGTREGGRI